MFKGKEIIMKWNRIVGCFAAGAMLWACSDGDRTTGTSEESEGIIADLDVAGLAQKGPFVKGSAVTVQGIDCKTLKFTDEIFEGEVRSDKGDFDVDNVTLSSTCAVFEVTGHYRNEITGERTEGELTLRALTNLKDRKKVNVNILTNLEYKRVINLMAEEEKTFAEAKSQAEKEVLAALGIADAIGDSEKFEDLDIFEKDDGNAALLAVSVMMQGNTDAVELAKRIDMIAEDIAEDGEWNDSKTKTEIAKWTAAAVQNGKLDSIRKNVESWGYTETVLAFEKYVEAFAAGDSVIRSSSSAEVIPASSEKDDSVISDHCAFSFSVFLK